MKKIALVVAGLLLAAWLVLRFPFYTEVPVNPNWEAQPAAAVPAGAVTVRFTGTTTLLFSDGETDWMVDGWFSRPGVLQLGLGKIEPDVEAVRAGLAANKVSNLVAVVPVHSHFDHAMDAPEVARQTGAILMGSESTANIGRGWGLGENQILVLQDEVPVRIGDFLLTVIESRHFQFPDPELRKRALENPRIEAPLKPPAKMLDYRVGKAYVLHVLHPRGSFAIVGSAGFEPAGLRGYSADVLFLGVGGLGSQTPEYREEFWRETVETLKPQTLVPVHYDSLIAPIEGPFRGESAILDFLAGGSDNTRVFLEEKAAADAGPAFMTLPRYREVVLFP